MERRPLLSARKGDEKLFGRQRSVKQEVKGFGNGARAHRELFSFCPDLAWAMRDRLRVPHKG